MQALLTQSALVFFLIGVVSMLTHAVKKWVAGEIRGNLIDWYMVQPRATLGALLACVGGIAAAVLSGQLTDYAQGAQIIAAWGIGYASDTINSQGKQ